MKNNLILCSIFTFTFLLNACKSEQSNLNQNSTSIIKNRYLGQKPPGATPKIFAPNIVSTNNWEIGGTFSPDLDEFYFIREVDQDNVKTMKMIVFKLKDDIWKDSIISPRVGQPFISPNGKKMHLGRYLKERTDKGWSKLKYVDSLFLKTPIMKLTASSKETYVFDELSEKGTLKYSRLVNGQREQPIAFHEGINSGKSNAHPFIAPDESYILWDSRRENGYGKADIYVSFKQDDGHWGKAINLGNQINTETSEFGASVTPDGKYLFFNRNVGKVNPTDPYDDVNIFWVSSKVLQELRQ